MSWIAGAAKLLGLLPSAVEAGRSFVDLFTGGNYSKTSSSSTAEANRHGTESGAARNRASKATEQVARGRKQMSTPAHVVKIRNITRFPAASTPASIEVLLLISSLLSEGERVTVDFDGTTGYSSAFLRDVFGGVGDRFPLPLLRERLELRSEDRSLVSEAWGYIVEAGGRPVVV